ncbi:PIN domain-containing protein [Stutzerimonas stutzeri]|uniref:hypothetical protein n=1 Tax=Stutzerimonas stutzeri TaxID=316 RepID=UPI00387DCC88
MEDAFDDLFDVAIIVSGDSDLAPPIQSVRHQPPEPLHRCAHGPRRCKHRLRPLPVAACSLQVVRCKVATE